MHTILKEPFTVNNFLDGKVEPIILDMCNDAVKRKDYKWFKYNL